MRRNRNGSLDAAVQNLEALAQRALAQAGDAAGAAFVVTPTSESVICSAYAPGTGGSILAAIDITPVTSGVLVLNASFLLETSAADTPEIVIVYVDLLTGITNGTPIQSPVSTGRILALPTSGSPITTTPPPGSGVDVFAYSDTVAATSFTPTFALPVLATEGHRTLIAFFGASSSATTTWTIDGQIAVLEKP